MLRRQPISTRTDPCFPYAALFRSDAVVPRVVHPDADRVALSHEGRFRVALQDRFDRAHFGKAAIADSALGDRLAGAAAGVAIRHRARPDDRSRAQIARLRRMGDRSEEHTSELQSLMRISYALFCIKQKYTAPITL